MFETIGYTMLKRVEDEIRQSLTKWEPRIRNLDVIVDVDRENTSVVLITIQYETKHTQHRQELNYSFYLNEGLEQS